MWEAIKNQLGSIPAGQYNEDGLNLQRSFQ